MENASKALLMAGGILIVMIIIALGMYSCKSISDYYSSKEDLAEIEDVKEFNLQFTGYDRDDVHGYEILSLCNKIVDYNYRVSNTGINDINANPITLAVNMNGKQFKLAHGTKNKLFTKVPQVYNQNQLSKVFNDAGIFESRLGSSSIASKVAKSIDSLILDENATLSEKKVAVKNYNIITNTNSYTEDEIGYGKMQKFITGETGDFGILKYYEYLQLKKVIFKCTGIKYNNVDGKVSAIGFEFTGEFE